MPITRNAAASVHAQTGITYVANGGAQNPGDLMVLQIVRHWAGGSPIATPAGWTLLHAQNSAGALWLLAYRFWQPTDTSWSFVGSWVGVQVYAGVDPGSPIAAFAAPAASVTIPEADCVVIDTASTQSFVTFTFDTPTGENLRYGQSVSGQEGQGLADTVGNTVTVGSRSPATWTRSGGTAPPATTTYAIIALRPIHLGGGWGVGMVRMGAN